MKIALLEPYPEIVPEYLNYLVDAGHTIFGYNEICDSKTIDAIIVRSKVTVDAALLDKYRSLSYVLRVGVGLEKIDTNLLEEKKIKLLNTPGSNSQSVAELVVWAMLSLLRNTSKKWTSLDDRFDFIGDELHGKTIGLIGFGNIGRIVHKILNNFGGNTFLVFDPYLDRSSIDAKDIQFVDAKEAIFSKSDVISFHIPLTSETRNFLSKSDFDLLKNTVKIINTSRGGIIDEDALISFLGQHTHAGAHIDTWEGEPANPKSGLLSLDNCIVTPHLGSMTQDANKAMHYFTI